MAQQSKEPCKKEACDIQACLSKNMFDSKKYVYGFLVFTSCQDSVRAQELGFVVGEVVGDAYGWWSWQQDDACFQLIGVSMIEHLNGAARCVRVIQLLQSCCEQCEYKSTHCGSLTGLLKNISK
uniref:Uncharacterized protein n=1 Tax=Oryza barthii TaxID=65489 RepID=A0A0D3HS36_9ORYZ